MIEYSFCFEGKDPIEFKVDLEQDTSLEGDRSDFPAWMALDRHRCGHCTIEPGSRKTCPAALALEPIAQSFGPYISYEQVLVTAMSKEIRVESVTTTQRAVRSLLGLLLALSECPTMKKLRPMASYHLPFGGTEQTTFRSVGMYLIAQYLRRLEGLEPDWNLSGFLQLYEDIHTVNAHLADRIRAACEKDAALNSLILLDSFSQITEMNVETNMKKLKPRFEMYLK